jgi:hypothetical protein
LNEKIDKGGEMTDFRLKMMAKADELTDFGKMYIAMFSFICEKKLEKEFIKYLDRRTR